MTLGEDQVGLTPMIATIVLIGLAIGFGLSILVGYLGALAPGPPPKHVSLSITYENDENKLAIIHEGGDPLFNAFVIGEGELLRWNGLELRVNGLTENRISSAVLNDENLPYSTSFTAGDELVLTLENRLKKGDIISLVYIPSNQVLMEMIIL